ncbi:MAG: phytoene desaturase [Tannerellaceae bacterium]|nr:phytoene desaturase [Tannerellaceae bacterium]
MKKVAIIGSGFSSLSAACYLAKAGYEVSIFEKNHTTGGRARQLKRDGFTFDMGPTFYWMPDVVERFFADFNHTAGDYYQLQRLDPGYQLYFEDGDTVKLHAGMEKIRQVFDHYQPGSGNFLQSFLKEAGFNYHVAMDKVVYRPGLSPLELVTPQTATRINQFVSSLSQQIRKNIHSPKLQQILEFPVLFLGAKPSDIPAFYCFMNYADMVLGTWHIQGGMYRLVDAMQKLAGSLGVTIHTDSPVQRIVVENKKVTGLWIKDIFHPTNLVISGADYHHTEQLLDKEWRNYSAPYWNRRVMAPAALLYYVGFNRKLDNLSHHTLFFDAGFSEHAAQIYDHPQWPEKPLFYTSFPTITDPSLAPEGKEAGIFLIPVAPGLADSDETREKYFRQLVGRMEKLTGQALHKEILFYESFGIRDFVTAYNAYKGNAYGLSNILLQTAFLKPKVINKKIGNLFYTGQLTVPGPGVPTAIISGKIAAGLAKKRLQKETGNYLLPA